MDSNQLKHFRGIAEQGNLTRAAEALYVSQPALSLSLSKLEDELGCLLFIRDKRRMILTESGKKLLTYAVKITDLVYEAEAYFSREKSSTRINFFRIGGVNYPLISRNCASVNCIYFYPVLVENSELRSVIESGEADIAVGDDRYVADYDGYVREFLYHQKLYVCVKPDHPLADREAITFSELGNYPIIARSNPVGFNSWIQEIKKLNRTDLQENANMSFNAWLHEGYKLWFPFLINNFGISTVWDNVKDMVIIPVNGKYTERDIYLYYRENEKERFRELLDIIKENAASTIEADHAIGF